jgi:hypothetical protein
MKHCLVSLVSDQTIPNVLVALHFRPDALLFLTTESMERKGKTDAILQCLAMRGLDYAERHWRVSVREDSLLHIEQELARWSQSQEEEFDYIVNLTGGTKLMSIAAYDYFQAFGSSMIYVPIPKNEFLTPFPKRRPKAPEALKDRLTVCEYLTAYGFKVANASDLDRKKELAEGRKELTRHIYQNYQELKSFLANLYEAMKTVAEDRKRLKKGLSFKLPFQPPAQGQEILREMGFQESAEGWIKKGFHRDDYEYLRGGWLEERLYLALKEVLPSESDVLLGVQYTNREGTSNELDVLFTLQNRLHLVECKSLDAAEGSEAGGTASLTNFLYKLGALRQEFGLTPVGYLATTSEDSLDKDGQPKESLVKRAKQFNIEMLPLVQIQDLEAWFQDKLFGNSPLKGAGLASQADIPS